MVKSKTQFARSVGEAGHKVDQETEISLVRGRQDRFINGQFGA